MRPRRTVRVLAGLAFAIAASLAGFAQSQEAPAPQAGLHFRYKSVDAGKTWAHVGLDETGRIARVVVHPRNPDIVFVCAVPDPADPDSVWATCDGDKVTRHDARTKAVRGPGGRTARRWS